MAREIEFVAAGVSSATDGATAPTPALPAGLADDDFMITCFYSREAIDGTVSISAGWTPIINDLSAGGLLAVWYRFRVTGDLAPTFTIGNHAANDTCIAQMAAWRGVNLLDPIDQIGTISTNAALTDIGPIAGVSLDRRGLLLIIGGKLDDWTSVNPVTSSNGATDEDMIYTEIDEPDSTLGNDAGMVWDYLINPGLELIIPQKIIDVVGGTSVAGKGVMLSFKLEPDAFVAADHIGLFCAIAHPLTDSGIPGGNIDPSMRAVFTDIAANDDLEVVSDDAADTTIPFTIRALDPSGNTVIQTATLNGTTPVVFSTLGTIERVEEAFLSVPAVGNVTVQRSVGGAVVAVIPAGERGFRRIFRRAYSHPDNAKDYYEKIFVRNIHTYYTIANVSIEEDTDPTGFLTFALSASIDDEAFSTSRLDPPADDDLQDPDTFDASLKMIPGDGSNLDPETSCGIWLKMSVPAAEPVFKDTYTLEIAGEVPA